VLDEELRFTSFGIVHLHGLILLFTILVMAAKIYPNSHLAFSQTQNGTKMSKYSSNCVRLYNQFFHNIHTPWSCYFKMLLRQKCQTSNNSGNITCIFMFSFIQCNVGQSSDMNWCGIAWNMDEHAAPHRSVDS